MADPIIDPKVEENLNTISKACKLPKLTENYGILLTTEGAKNDYRKLYKQAGDLFVKALIAEGIEPNDANIGANLLLEGKEIKSTIKEIIDSAPEDAQIKWVLRAFTLIKSGEIAHNKNLDFRNKFFSSAAEDIAKMKNPSDYSETGSFKQLCDTIASDVKNPIVSSGIALYQGMLALLQTDPTKPQ
jgi:hypothetical protein